MSFACPHSVWKTHTNTHFSGLTDVQYMHKYFMTTLSHVMFASMKTLQVPVKGLDTISYLHE